MRHHVIEDLVAQFIPENAYAEQWDATALRERLREVIAIDFPVEEWAKEEGIADAEIRERVIQAADKLYTEKREKFTPEIMSQVEKAVLLRTLDNLWRDHIVTVEHLRQVIHLRGYGQRDPLNEYKTEGFTLFEALIAKLRENATSQVMRVEIQTRPADDMLPDEEELPFMQAHHIDALTGENDVGEGTLFGAATLAAPALALNPKKPETWGKVARNDSCPCGSGKKFKHCHGAFV
jgi:preprotein translocase subunit SecA